MAQVAPSPSSGLINIYHFISDIEMHGDKKLSNLYMESKILDAEKTWINDGTNHDQPIITGRSTNVIFEAFGYSLDGIAGGGEVLNKYI